MGYSSVGPRALRCAAALAACIAAGAACASPQQFDITGPAGSVSFGASVAVLPNGNIVVADPDGVASGVGAVYLYKRDGTLLSSITGSTPSDHVGSGGIVVLADGNFVLLSPHWHNDVVADAGAVTWASGTAGISGAVSSGNSLVGTTQGDLVGSPGSVVALSNGNYVVDTPAWSTTGGSPVSGVGAVTFGRGSTGIVGAISAANSLVGAAAGDAIGSGLVQVLSNGNYVVVSPVWNGQAGAVTLGDGTNGTTGPVTPGNSLVGSNAGDGVGGSGITPLPSGDFVVDSSNWANGAATQAGAVTFVSGSSGASGTLSSSNSFVGSRSNDHVGSGGITVLTNGNYVIASPDCANVSVQQAGAVTWANGTSGSSGVVGPSNSIVGTQANDAVGGGFVGRTRNVVALADGNYAVISSLWANGSNTDAGAVTWVDGTAAHNGIVSAANSLVGTKMNDRVGITGVFPLPNGDYVVGSYFWSDSATANVGAATLLRGGHSTSATISAANSLIGSTSNDLVGFAIVALSNGNYVVGSQVWENGMANHVGAVTWVDGSVGLTGAVSTSNSLVGDSGQDYVGYPIALRNGNYVVTSPQWHGVGAVTWGNGASGTTGVVSAANSLVGAQSQDLVGYRDATPLPRGYYITENLSWANGSTAQAGAVSLGQGDGSTVGPVSAANSVLGTVAGGGLRMVDTFDVPHETLIVGRPAENIVSQFNYGDTIFAYGYETL